MVEAAGYDWLVQLLRGLQLGAGVLVPEAEAAVRANGGQRAVDGMEGDGVHLMGENSRQDTVGNEMSERVSHEADLSRPGRKTR